MSRLISENMRIAITRIINEDSVTKARNMYHSILQKKGVHESSPEYIHKMQGFLAEYKNGTSIKESIDSAESKFLEIQEELKDLAEGLKKIGDATSDVHKHVNKLFGPKQYGSMLKGTISHVEHHAEDGSSTVHIRHTQPQTKNVVSAIDHVREGNANEFNHAPGEVLHTKTKTMKDGYKSDPKSPSVDIHTKTHPLSGGWLHTEVHFKPSKVKLKEEEDLDEQTGDVHTKLSRLNKELLDIRQREGVKKAVPGSRQHEVEQQIAKHKKSLGEEVELSEARSPGHDPKIHQEHQQLKSLSIDEVQKRHKALNRVQGSYTPNEVGGKQGMIADILRAHHGNKKVAAHFGLKEEVDLEEAKESQPVHHFHAFQSGYWGRSPLSKKIKTVKGGTAKEAERKISEKHPNKRLGNGDSVHYGHTHTVEADGSITKGHYHYHGAENIKEELVDEGMMGLESTSSHKQEADKHPIGSKLYYHHTGLHHESMAKIASDNGNHLKAREHRIAAGKYKKVADEMNEAFPSPNNSSAKKLTTESPIVNDFVEPSDTEQKDLPSGIAEEFNSHDQASTRKDYLDKKHPRTMHEVVQGRRSGKYFVVRKNQHGSHVAEAVCFPDLESGGATQTMKTYDDSTKAIGEDSKERRVNKIKSIVHSTTKE